MYVTVVDILLVGFIDVYFYSYSNNSLRALQKKIKTYQDEPHQQLGILQQAHANLCQTQTELQLLIYIKQMTKRNVKDSNH